MDITKINHISLCAGYGGIDLGLKRAIPTLRNIAYVEIEAFSCSHLVSKMEAKLMDAAPIWSNLKTFPWHLYRGKVDLISGGFPCQPFSAAGKGKGDNDPRHLFPYIVEGIRTAKPAIVFLENVEGIVSAKLKGDHWNDPAGTPVLLHVLRELERVGYRATAIATSASEVGAPHQRNRWFIVGLADSDRGRRWEDFLRSELRATGTEQPPGSSRVCSDTGEKRKVSFWSAGPGDDQHQWEPPRTIPNSESGRSGLQRCGDEKEVTKLRDNGSHGNLVDSGSCKQQGLSQSEERRENPKTRQPSGNGKIKPSMGGNTDGIADRMGSAELYTTNDNRTDELRMLGNGVVPACAELAFRLGMEELLT